MKKLLTQSYLLLPFVLLAILGLVGFQQPQTTTQNNPKKSIDQKVDSILSLLSIEEKVGQLNQLRGAKMVENNDKDVSIDVKEAIKEGKVGTFLNVWNLSDKIDLQKIAVEESPHGIPLIFAMDVIHGFRTTFPVPLAEAASWNIDAIKRSAEIAALEASSTGLMWTFAPMVDVSYDARWGRSMEGGGEDPYLGSQVAVARVQGFQGEDLTKPNTIMACVKHFAGYGQVQAGRDYNQTTISKRYLHDYVLPPFKAAADAGAASFMNAFNDFDGVPCSGSKYLVTDILKERWGFEGVVVSDWNSFEEMTHWGFAKDRKHAAELAIKAGSDIDMMSLVYHDYLVELVKEGTVDEETVNKAVRRVLKMKYQLGLFDDPYLYFNPDLYDQVSYAPEHRAHARKITRESMVLLKNDNKLLPLNADQYQSIAVIGPSDADPSTHMGTWSAGGDPDSVITFTQGLKDFYGEKATITFEAGCKDERNADSKKLKAAIKAAKKADLIILTLGEGRWYSGENTSLTDISLPAPQVELAKEIYKLGKPTVCVLVNGRPITFPWLKENAPTILEAWAGGCEAGNALVDVLFGAYNPAGKLPITFPENVGQAPISYMIKNTGRPYATGSHYKDAPNTPAFPFGFGLSYTEFSFSDLKLNKDIFEKGEEIQVSVTLNNTGDFDGTEVVQLYIRDIVGSVTRPLKELKRFKRISLAKGTQQEIQFTLTTEDLKFWNQNMEYVAETGTFEIHIGSNSAETISTTFTLN